MVHWPVGKWKILRFRRVLAKHLGSCVDRDGGLSHAHTSFMTDDSWHKLICGRCSHPWTPRLHDTVPSRLYLDPTRRLCFGFGRIRHICYSARYAYPSPTHAHSVSATVVPIRSMFGVLYCGNTSIYQYNDQSGNDKFMLIIIEEGWSSEVGYFRSTLITPHKKYVSRGDFYVLKFDGWVLQEITRSPPLLSSYHLDGGNLRGRVRIWVVRYATLYV